MSIFDRFFRTRKGSVARSCSRSSRRRRHRQEARFSRPRLGLERLESRALLTANLALSGPQSLLAGQNIDVSNDPSVQHTEMMVAVNPANPLNIAGFTHHITTSGGVTTITEIDVYFSLNGGASWTLTPITGSVDGKPSGDTRFDPGIAFDANGDLYVSYGADSGSQTSLMVDESTNGGASFTRFTAVDTEADINVQGAVLPGVDKPQIATGLDPATGQQAVYVAYTQNVLQNGSVNQRIAVAGSNNGDASFTSPTIINDASINGISDGNIYADPAVGPNGELYVSWQSGGGSVLIDKDLDGLWGTAHSFGADVTVVTPSTPMFEQKVPAQPDRGISTAPVIAVDKSGGAYNGRLYIAYVDATSTASLPETSVNVVSSSSQGSTWSAPSTIAAGQNTNFLPWIAVDQSSGSVDVDYYASNGYAAQSANVLMAESTNGGAGFPFGETVSSASSNASTDPYQGNYLEYIGLAALDGTAHAFWADNRAADNPSDFEAYTASVATSGSGNTLTVGADTSGNTSFLVRMDPDNTSYIEVQVNGKDEFVGLLSSLGDIVVNGGSGNDSLTIDASYGDPIPPGGISYNGSYGINSLSVKADASFSLGNGVLTLSGDDAGTVSVTNATNASLTSFFVGPAPPPHFFTINGWHGTAVANLLSGDSATLYALPTFSGSSFNATPTQTTLTGSDYTYSTSGGASISAVAAGSSDTATLGDAGSPGTLYTHPLATTFSGSGYSNTAENFGGVSATSSYGSDVAYMDDNGATGASNFYAYTGYSYWAGTASQRGYYTQANGFKTVESDAYNASDDAQMNDSSSPGTLLTHPLASQFVGPSGSYNNAVYHFGSVTATSYYSSDVADMDDNGATGASNFYSLPDSSYWQGNTSLGGYMTKEVGFKTVNSVSFNTGDFAWLTDNVGGAYMSGSYAPEMQYSNGTIVGLDNFGGFGNFHVSVYNTAPGGVYDTAQSSLRPYVVFYGNWTYV